MRLTQIEELKNVGRVNYAAVAAVVAAAADASAERGSWRQLKIMHPA